MLMVHPSTPVRAYESRQDGSMRPTWERPTIHLNDEHRAIFDRTKALPGWQAPGDSYKLYEMGHYAGDVILEIGTYGGRSAAVELRGALSRPGRRTPPQFFGIDLDPAAIRRTYATLQQEGLAEHALLYYGTLPDFVPHFDIRPTMVFVDGDHRYEGVKKDLDTLSGFLAPGVPVLCHDYTNPENDTGELGVRRAVTEWEEAGFAEFMGVFGVSVLLRTTAQCRGGGRRWPADEFERRRTGLLKDYGILPRRVFGR